ncbi:glycosyltransferase [Mucilaginibacter auburnensis]|uniref:Cellulose synthase/poly-beta-1,6-N-acetylglucosamine synthase-like glycosyltransferase n=1 Tax=Mucilaginibacter auburnensis TaxID=1457233 RepID=A0A2H9VTI4_9SPHI|nr:glycosyltransferase family 2 protein [Mucilaginibacter auburnensis]PJJ84136.1 cellulose synthase/poly-beta-1,6-N-acetylglucosamine synthase-like glycosyltransferase [Mucilaginibacter auburnensis]
MIYIIAATLLFIILRFTVTLFNFISDPKLRRVNRRYTDLVSILIPVRNESRQILTLLESIYRQDYSNYEVIILDDDSDDDTFNLCKTFCDTHTNFRLIKGKKLEAGWTGKNFACHQLALAARGDFLLFLDADEQVNNGLINTAIYRMYQYKLGLLSVFANASMLSTGELAVVPLQHYLLLGLLPLRLVYLIKNHSIATASGQFMLFDAQSYREHKWHQKVKEKVVEDTEIMRMVKAAGYRGETLLANGMLSSRMYTGFSEAIGGFSKNVLSVFNYNIIWFLIYILLTITGPMVVFISLNIPIILFMVALIILSRIMSSFSAGQNPVWNVVLHPVQMLSLTAISFIAIQKYLTHTLTWKGRRV